MAFAEAEVRPTPKVEMAKISGSKDKYADEANPYPAADVMQTNIVNLDFESIR